ncbi:hypothetical protein ABZ829_28240 [Streptomyces xanthochromogenes]|uniref:hypothetical protein n=1 Tax=Streptomyces xanthochromogenes TaxID=67384 RepID=UPI00341E5133
MNTTAAALKAHVSVDTIRAWCRIGAVSAVKAAGRWLIDTTSLARRIAIGAMRARKQRPVNQPAEPVEVRIDEWTTIRASQETSPAFGTTTWYAVEYINGYRTGCIPSDGATAEEAIEKMRYKIKQMRAQKERQAILMGSLAASGVSVECVDTLGDGIRMATTSTSGQCHYCGLNVRTCDCR